MNMILKMSEEFVDWLDSCPCQWFLDSNKEEGTATYTFVENEVV